MGINLFSACHKHKCKVYHYRGLESVTMMPFYYKHRSCLEQEPQQSVETREDQEQETKWMDDFGHGGYPYDEEIQALAEKELDTRRLKGKKS